MNLKQRLQFYDDKQAVWTNDKKCKLFCITFSLPGPPPPEETTAAPHEPESPGLTTEHKIIIGVCVSVFALIGLIVIVVVAVKMYQKK